MILLAAMMQLHSPQALRLGTITITASAAIFTPAMVGGLFTGNGGIVRIGAFTDATHVTGFTTEDFSSTDPILGSLAFLGEPAWSDARGLPALASSYQSRSVFVLNGLASKRSLAVGY